MQIKGSGIH